MLKLNDEVSDARRAGDVDTSKELIAETMKLFGNSAYGKTVTNKENFVSASYGKEDNISKKINSPHFKDLEQLYGQKYEVISTKERTCILIRPCWDVKLVSLLRGFEPHSHPRTESSRVGLG